MFYKLSAPALLTTLLITGCDGSPAPIVDDKGVAPVAIDDTLHLIEDTPKRETARATDRDGDTLTFSIKSPATKGNAYFLDTATGEFEYIPYPNEEGDDSFIFEVTDGKNTASATISISILGIPDPAAAGNDQFTVLEGALLSINAENGVLTNDSAVDKKDSLNAATLIQDAQHGNLTLNPDGSFEYQHNGSENSSDEFIYKVSNSTGAATATVTLTITPVNDAPVALNDSGSGYLIGKGGTLNNSSLNVLNNDSDAEGDQLEAILTSQAGKGSVVLALDGTFSYTHNGTNSTSDSFTYQAKDSNGALSTPATVTIVINEPPVAVNDAYTLQGSGWVITGNLLTNDSDPESNPLSILTADVTDPAHGSVTVNSNGSFSYTYNKSGATQDSFTYRAYDGFGKSNEATVTLDIHTLPTAVADNYSVIIGKSISVEANAGVRNNDSDAETATDNLLVSLTSTPACTATGGFTLNSDGSFNYTHNGNESCASDNFTYKVTDAAGGSATATVTITVLDNVPVAANDTFQVAEAGSVSPDFASGVLANDDDSETAKADLVVTLLPNTGPQCATVAPFILNTDGSFSYTHNGDDNCNTDSFEYRVTNENGGSSTATVTLNIDIQNDAPYFLPGHNGNSTNGSNEYEVLEFDLAGSKAKNTGLLRTVEDDENDPLELRVITGPQHGTLKLKLGNSYITYQNGDTRLFSEDFSYNYDGEGPYNYGNTLDLTKCANGNPSEVFAGLTSDQIEAISSNESEVPFCWQNKDTIEVVAVDSYGNESQASTINLFLNVQPVAMDDDGVTTAIDTPVVIDAFSNDYDRDGAIVPSRVFGLSCSDGTIEYENEKLKYTPSAGFSGIATCKYKVRDNKRVSWNTNYIGAPSNEATITINVGGSENTTNHNVTSNCEAQKIMPLGDSITEGIPERPGYRNSLYSSLSSSYNIDFVGSRYNGNGGDNDHEGHPGMSADWIRDNVIGFLNNNPADIILLHIGTNDLNTPTFQPPGEIATEINSILGNINSWASNQGENINVLLAKIIDFNPTNPNVTELNNLIASMGSSTWSNIDVGIVNQYSALTDRNAGGDWADVLHPSSNGYAKMAGRWKDALLPLLNQC